MKQTFIASASELQRSPLFLQITTPMFVADEPNLNNVACTEAFIDDIIANQDQYAGLPLVADITALVSGDYLSLGHLYDRHTNQYKTASIGTFQEFKKVELGSGKKALVGYARVWKRNKAVCRALSQMFTDDILKFSFEINAGSLQVNENSTQIIDASVDNYLEGMCVVSFPACPEAVAEQLVAEIMIPKDGDSMKDTKTKVAEAEAEVKAEAEVAEAAEAKAEAETAEEEKVEAAETPVEVKAETEEEDEEEKEEQPKEACNNKKADEEDAACNEKKAEAEVAAAENVPNDTESKMYAELANKLDEMAAAIAELVKIVTEDKAVEKAVAEIENSDIGEGANVMLAEAEAGNDNSTYSLLKPAERVTNYSLL